MAKKQDGILSALKVRAASFPKLNPTWFDRLDESVQEELRAAKGAFLRGELGDMGLRRFATIMSDELAARKIAVIGPQGVETWLKRN